MSPRDLVYVGHMLDMARKAVDETGGLSRPRHKVVHDYLGVDEDIVWQVVTEDLPQLVAALQPLVPSQSQ